MTLSFMALPVIPTLRITTRGVFDVGSQRYVEKKRAYAKGERLPPFSFCVCGAWVSGR